MNLTDPTTRAAVTERLGQALYGGRPVILGPGILAGYTATVEHCRALGCPVLVLAAARGVGPVPADGECTVVDVEMPRTASMTEEVRVLDRVARTLPEPAVAAIEAFDPERRAVWIGSPFISSDRPILGRPVTGGRPASYAALEDKMRSDEIWAAAGVPYLPSRVLATDATALAAASLELDTPLGTVWSGDARDGINGGGNFVRWVLDDADRTAAFAFFAPRCDRVRVSPFLDGVPCSIHGVVLPGGTAVFRPVELAILREPRQRRFVYGGLSTWWDPPAADREEMRTTARRVGDLLAREHAYRGAFGIDGVLTADGFRPTELNARMSAGVSTIARVAADLFGFLQAALVAGLDPEVDVAELEALVGLMDAGRTGLPTGIGQGVSLSEAYEGPVAYDGRVLTRTAEETGSALKCANNPLGFFARVDPCTLLAPGDRIAPLNAALYALLDRDLGTDFGDLEAAPDLR